MLSYIFDLLWAYNVHSVSVDEDWMLYGCTSLCWYTDPDTDVHTPQFCPQLACRYGSTDGFYQLRRMGRLWLPLVSRTQCYQTGAISRTQSVSRSDV